MSNPSSPNSNEPLPKKREKGFFVSLRRILSRRRLLSRAPDSTTQLLSPPSPFIAGGSGSSALLSAVAVDGCEASHGFKAPPRSSASMPLLFPTTAANSLNHLPFFGGASPLPSGAFVGARRVVPASSSTSSTTFMQLPAIDSFTPGISGGATPDRQVDSSSLPRQLTAVACSGAAAESGRLRQLAVAPITVARGDGGSGGGGASSPCQQRQRSAAEPSDHSTSSLPLPAISRCLTPRESAKAAPTASPAWGAAAADAAALVNGTTAEPTADPLGAAAVAAKGGNPEGACGFSFASAAVASEWAAAAAAVGGGTAAKLRTAPTTPIASPTVVSPYRQPGSSAATVAPATSPAASAAAAVWPAEEGGGTLLAVGASAPAAMRRAVWRLADYSISGRLYKGEVSAVYKAACKLSGCRVVLKVYSLSRVADNALHTLVREVRIHTDLAHDNVLTMYGVFEEDDRLVLVLERAVRGDLFHLHRSLPRGRMSEDQLRVLVLAPLLDALVYLHGRGVCHRDIKPENLLMTGGWQLRVADFGAAIDLTQERAVTRTGTMDYMAPEVERCPLKLLPEDNKGNPDLAYTTAVDVWSVGVLSYELLVGFPPFINCSAEAGQGGGGGGGADRRELCFPHFVSAGGQDFIACALADRPMDRPTAAQLLRHPWLKHAVRQHQARQQQQKQLQLQQQQHHHQQQHQQHQQHQQQKPLQPHPQLLHQRSACELSNGGGPFKAPAAPEQHLRDHHLRDHHLRDHHLRDHHLRDHHLQNQQQQQQFHAHSPPTSSSEGALPSQRTARCSRLVHRDGRSRLQINSSSISTSFQT